LLKLNVIKVRQTNGQATATPAKAFDRAYINGQFVTPHGTQVVDHVNPTDNKVIGKVTMAGEIDIRPRS
jgi:aldehyde dehydrogenase (NAD+)